MLIAELHGEGVQSVSPSLQDVHCNSPQHFHVDEVAPHPLFIKKKKKDNLNLTVTFLIILSLYHAKKLKTTQSFNLNKKSTPETNLSPLVTQTISQENINK